MKDFHANIALSGIDPKKRMVYGFANVSMNEGKPVVDTQGGYIPLEVMRKSATDFIQKGGRVQLQHEDLSTPARGKVVESLVIDDGISKSLGIQDTRHGWYVGVEVTDEATWELAQSGLLSGLSIAGHGKYVKLGKETPLGGSSQDGVKLYRDISLSELSLVVQPANELALVDSVIKKGKNMDIKELEEKLAKASQELEEAKKKLTEAEVKLSAQGKPESVQQAIAKGASDETIERLEVLEKAYAKGQIEKTLQGTIAEGNEELAKALVGLPASNLGIVLDVLKKAKDGTKEATEKTQKVIEDTALALGAKASKAKVSDAGSDTQDKTTQALIEYNRKKGIMK